MFENLRSAGCSQISCGNKVLYGEWNSTEFTDLTIFSHFIGMFGLLESPLLINGNEGMEFLIYTRYPLQTASCQFHRG